MANSLGQSISKILLRENYILWKAQVLAAVRGAQLYGYLDGTASARSRTIQVEQADKTMKAKDNPSYAAWYAQDQ
jgi:hypothetical protein